MKKILLTVFTITALMTTIFAQDTIFLYRDGMVVFKRALTDIDSIIFYKPELPQTTVQDIDGNVYDIVTIGSQIWMADNLRTTRYNNGDAVTQITDNTEWINQTTGAYCWYGNDSALYEMTYGKLYNWFAASANNICPTGWHTPTDNEWTILTDFLGGTTGAGSMLKEVGNLNWNAPNTDATNTTGFTALPGGYRLNNGSFAGIGATGAFWSATEVSYNTAKGWNRTMSNANGDVGRADGYKIMGYSVRCLKD